MSMGLDDQISASIDRLYRAAYEPQILDAALEAVRCMLGATSALVALRAPEHLGFRKFGAAQNLDPAMLEKYAEHYHTIDPYRRLVAELPPNHVHDSERLGDATWLRGSEFFNDFLCAADTPRWLGLDGLTFEGAHLSFAFHRSSSGVSFEDETLQVAAHLRPHLVHATALAARVSTLETRASWAAALLEQYGCPAMLVNRAARVLLANAAGESLLRAATDLCSTRGGLRARRSEHTRAIQRAVARGREAGGSVVWIPCELGQELMVVVTPFPRSTQDIDRAIPTDAWALIRVLDPTELPNGDPKLFAGAFDLTPAESRVAAALVKGLSPIEIAVSFGIREGTARNHIKRVFAKTGTSRQGELIALLCRVT